MKILKPKNLFTYIVILFAGILPSCKDDTPDPILFVQKVKMQTRNVLIANQGNGGGGSLSIYTTRSKEVMHNVYEMFSMEVKHNVYEQANGEKLGGHLVALTQIDDKYYFVLHDVGKIIVTDSNFINLGEISGLKSPSQIYKVAEGKAYVTSASVKYLTVIDLKSNTTSGVMGTLDVLTTGVVRDSFFIGLVPNQNSFLEIDVKRDSVTEVISAYSGMNGIFLDKNDLVRIHYEDQNMILTWFRSNGKNILDGAFLRGRLASVVYSSLNDKFYSINRNDNSIWESEVEFRSATSKVLAKAGVEHGELQTLAIDPMSGEAYTSYQMEGNDSTRVLHYSETGQLLQDFSVASPTSNFFFP